MKKQLMIFDFVYTGIAAILLLTIAILQNCGINITHENVIGIIVLIILFVLILLSTVNVLGCNYPTSKITFLQTDIAVHCVIHFLFVCRLLGFIGKAGNVWNSIMFAHFGHYSIKTILLHLQITHSRKICKITFCLYQRH